MDTAYTHIWSKTGMVSSEVKAKAVVVTPCTVWPAAVTAGTAMTTPPRPQPTSMRL